ncbi:hypothetical protein NQ318_023659 [Aromia moschata]|uniref:Uncharacterized protein n=1 Tax=Aromia moschata TaxID=1265417 RepID=A0AAV8XRK9_9CUCU|nr:hypothetical protein NQ318_023659 [Aromia moschata]
MKKYYYTTNNLAARQHPPHNVRPMTNYLNQKYNLWIGKNGPIHWPAKSPDLNPLDFFLWGTLKNNIYGEELSRDMSLCN